MSIHFASALSNPALLAVLGSTLVVIGGVIALVTALINRQTALAGRETKVLATPTADRAHDQEVLLPPRLRGFVNRSEAMEQAAAEIGAGERVLAIEGGSGIGKSAVAAEIAHRLREDDWDDRDGLPDLGGHDFLWIDGHDAAPTLVDICQQVTLLTGDQSLSSIADEAKLHALRAHLARRKTVLLLDNIRLRTDSSLDPLRELLEGVPSGSLVIASVNSPHALDASRVVLGELEPDHVLELVQHHARRLGLDPGLFGEELVARLRNAVGGNPRLIESFLRALSRSAEPLDDLLVAVERGDGLRELFLPVWGDLSDPARALLGACAYLKGQAIAEQLAVACDLSREDLAAPLAELVQLGLVTVVRAVDRPEIYACSYGVQRFAVGETPLDTGVTLTRRLAAFYVRQFATEPENARWAIPHVAGAKAVLQWLFDQRDDAEVQALFMSVLDILYTLGLFDDRITTGRLAYDSAVRAGNHRGASLATDVLSSTHAARGEIRAAEEAVALGLVAAERSGDSGERARQMRATALVLYKSRQATEAIAALDGADELARALGELEILVNVLGVRTVAHWYAGDFEAAGAAAEECLRVCREMSWQRATAYPLRNLAELAIQRGDFDQARALVEQARDIATEYGDRRQLARVFLTTARLELFCGRPRVAGARASAAEAEAIELGLSPELGEARAIRRAATRARLFPPLRSHYARRRPPRFTDGPIGGD